LQQLEEDIGFPAKREFAAVHTEWAALRPSAGSRWWWWRQQ